MSMLYYISRKGYYTDDEEKEGLYTRIEMSAGGGMGGSRWNIYTKKEISLEDLENNRFLEVVHINGKKRIINTNFITEADKIEIKYDMFDLKRDHDTKIKLRW